VLADLFSRNPSSSDAASCHMLALPPALFRGGSVSASSHASAVDGLADTCLIGAVGAAVKIFRSFYSVANDLATTAGTFRRHRLNGAFKAVKDVRLPARGNLEGFIVLVAASFTTCHCESSFNQEFRILTALELTLLSG
jgi:hypothetical protein